MPRMSLRQLLVLVALVALAIVSLKHASVFWRGVVGLVVFVAYVGCIIAAVMERGRRQAFAVGMAITMTIYGGLILCSGLADGMPGNYEFVPYNGVLPTTNLLTPLYYSIVDYEDVVENGAIVRQIEHPDSATFMTTGHYWRAVVLGYAGGRFARYLYVRRKEESPLATQQP
jgi:hypothetical protein